MSKTILITGASSGFGRDTAETLFQAKVAEALGLSHLEKIA
jgi:NADP-dependent 3-hydroxy acid dehydrogenase YdfG